jgi:hypothetical protein
VFASEHAYTLLSKFEAFILQMRGNCAVPVAQFPKLLDTFDDLGFDFSWGPGPATRWKAPFLELALERL